MSPRRKTEPTLSFAAVLITEDRASWVMSPQLTSVVRVKHLSLTCRFLCLCNQPWNVKVWNVVSSKKSNIFYLFLAQFTQVDGINVLLQVCWWSFHSKYFIVDLFFLNNLLFRFKKAQSCGDWKKKDLTRSIQWESAPPQRGLCPLALSAWARQLVGTPPLGGVWHNVLLLLYVI